MEDENIKLYEKLKEVNSLIENLKSENDSLSKLTQKQAIEILNVDQESKLLKDVLNLEKINVSESLKQKLISNINPSINNRNEKIAHKRDVFYTIISEVQSILNRVVPNKDKIPNGLIEKLQNIYSSQIEKNEELGSKVKKYLDFISNIQIKLEVKINNCSMVC